MRCGTVAPRLESRLVDTNAPRGKSSDGAIQVYLAQLLPDLPGAKDFPWRGYDRHLEAAGRGESAGAGRSVGVRAGPLRLRGACRARHHRLALGQQRLTAVTRAHASLRPPIARR